LADISKPLVTRKILAQLSELGGQSPPLPPLATRLPHENLWRAVVCPLLTLAIKRLQEGVLRLAKKTNFILLLDSNRPGPRVEQGVVMLSKQAYGKV